VVPEVQALRQRGLWLAEPQADVRRVCRPPSPTVSSPQPLGRSPQALWDGYSPVSPSHPYLTRKRIGTHGARAAPGQSTLAIPLTDMAGAIYGLQSISADGTKKFSFGSKATGHFFLIGEAEPSTTCYIAEGFATAASIHEAMGGLAVVAFNAGNLGPVAQALRRQWPDRPLVLCADDDAKTSGNPGLSAARAAAKVAISTLVNSLKGVSSRMIRKKNYPSIHKMLWGKTLWSPSYFAGRSVHSRAILPRPEGRGLPRIGVNAPSCGLRSSLDDLSFYRSQVHKNT